jgi:hypothetical protein
METLTQQERQWMSVTCTIVFTLGEGRLSQVGSPKRRLTRTLNIMTGTGMG